MSNRYVGAPARWIAFFVLATSLGLAATLSSCTDAEDTSQPSPVPSSSGPIVDVAYAFASPLLREITSPPREEGEDEKELVHAPLRSDVPFLDEGPDRALQLEAPRVSMPVTLRNFLGQGTTLGGCIFPRPDGGEPSGCTTTGVPPDTNGAVGPNHYVQVVNGGIAIWFKDGTIAQAPKLLNALWAGYTGTNPGNGCAAQNDGDPVVLYDQLADRWFVSQFSLPNCDPNTGNCAAPSFQCVGVSQSGDPTGAYWLYDFKYNAGINDYPKFGVWPDAYYASFNNFGANGNSQGANACAYDRVSMLSGAPAKQQCFQQNNGIFGLLPSNVDGPIKPPNGEPGFFVTLRTGTSISLYKFHVDWATPANSKFSLASNLTVQSYSQLCGGSACVPQPAPGNKVGSLGNRPMFHLSYRNFGTMESLVFNHSVSAGATSGPRWYDIRSPNGTPTIAQQGTFAPGDGKYRWMGSITQDQAQGMALGYSVSSTTTLPSIGWTGRLGTDPINQMAQGESIVQVGNGTESGTFSDGSTANRWGDYSNMSIDPSDDCTFWYTTELYPSNGVGAWDTRVSSVRFAQCAQNDFGIALAPVMNTVAPGGQVTYTVSTTSTVGTAENIDLVVQDLPAGVTGVLMPASVSAGGTSTLTLTAGAAAPLTGTPAPTFMVIGKAQSAVHFATGQIAVATSCVPRTACPAGDDCGMVSDLCGGVLNCGSCAPPKSCGGGGTPNVCGCTPIAACPAGTNCGTVDDGCGGMLGCGTCGGSDVCVQNQCVMVAVDAGVDAGGSVDAGVDAGGGVDAGIDAGGSVDAGIDASAGMDAGLVVDATTPDIDANVPPPVDAAVPAKDSGTDASMKPPPKVDSGAPVADAGDGDAAVDQGGSGDSSGCGCRTVSQPSHTPASIATAFGVVLAGLATWTRRRRRRASSLTRENDARARR